MKIEIRKTTKDGIVQITTLDERWYSKELEDNTYKYYPSSSWVSSFYPKGVQYYKWLAQKGWNEAEEIKNLAGERGSKIHNAIDMLIQGNKLHLDDKYLDTSGNEGELTPDEWEAIMSFKSWHDETNPEYIANEYTVINEQDNYAGTVDIKCKIGDQLYIVDIKTSQYIWPSHEIQLASYKHADTDTDKLKIAILQVGYRLNKKKYKFTELDDKYHLFLAAKTIWSEENSKVQPSQKDYPLTIKL